VRAVTATALAFLAVVLPWHLYELARGGGLCARGSACDVMEKMGGHPPPSDYLRALAVTALPWLPVAAVGAWRSWRGARSGPGFRLLVVWTIVVYGFLLVAGKHSPRYLMLLHPALALWAALGLLPLLPPSRQLAAGIGVAAAPRRGLMLTWPPPLPPG